MTWSRRELLHACGLAATTPWLAACGARETPKTGSHTAEVRSWRAIRTQLRQLVASGAAASAFARIVERTASSAEAVEHSAEHHSWGGAVLIGPDGGESATTDLSEPGLARAAQALTGRGPGAPGLAPGQERLVGQTDAAPGYVGPLARAQQLFERARNLGGSRIVFRATLVETEDARSTVISAEHGERAQRIGRTRMGLALLAAAGADTFGASVEHRGTISASALAITDAQLAQAAEDALALLTSRTISAGSYQVLMTAPVATQLIRSSVAPALLGHHWRSGISPAALLAGQPLGSPELSLLDDPTLAGGWHSYAFDDEGTTATSTELIRAGELLTPLATRADAEPLDAAVTGNARRLRPTDPLVTTASNLRLQASASAPTSLLPAVDTGLLLEGLQAIRVDLPRWSATIRVARAREIRSGKLTGRLFGPVMMTAQVPALLRQTRAVAADGAVLSRALVTPC